MIKSALSIAGAFLAAASAQAFVERAVTCDTTIDVPTGATNRIDYLSGTVAATVTKTGGGVLEIGVLGNENFTFMVQEGTLKSIPPQLGLGDRVWFRADASDAASMTFNAKNGTNFVSRWNDADGRDRYVTPITGLPSPGPFVSQVTLNGLATMDFGGFRDVGAYGDPPKGHLDLSAAGFKTSETALIAENFYIWQDVEGVRDLPLAISGGAETAFVGPTPINTLSCGYRGKGGNGSGYPLWNTAPDRMGLHFYLDDVKRSGSYVPEEGWHLARYYVDPDWDRSSTSSHLKDYGFQGFGFWNSRYGGCRLAEVVLCTNRLTTAEHAYVDRYLKVKWFGAAKTPFVCVSADAAFDTSEYSWAVNRFCAERDSGIVGASRLRALEISGTNDMIVAVSGTYEAADRLEAATPSLRFAGPGAVAVARGTARGNVIDATGTLAKSGAGTLEVSYLSENVTGLAVNEGALVLSPLLSAASALHFDATTNVTTEACGGTNLVTNWGDVNEGRGSALVTSAAYYKFRSEKVKNPFLAARAAGELPLVDFGGLVDYAHTNGNLGAGLDATHGLAGGGLKDPSVFVKADGWQQAFAVWRDDDGAKDLALVGGAEFTGPCMFGVSYMWTRGNGGGGNGFPLCGADSSAFREDIRVDGVRIAPAACKTQRMADGLHVYDNRPGLVDGLIGVTTAGFREQTKERAVYGGLKLGEMIFFRHRLPDAQRAKIAAALGVKWLGSVAYKLEQIFDSLSVAGGACASFPYADVTVTNLTASGAISARSLTVASGGTLTVTGTGGAVSCLTANAVSFAGGGTIILSGPSLGETAAEPIRVIAAADGPAQPRRVHGWRPAGGGRIVLVRKTDGYYLDNAPGMTLIVK